MQIDPINLGVIETEKKKAPASERKLSLLSWAKSSLSTAPSSENNYDLDIKAILNTVSAHQQTGSVTCPPCNETNNSCHGTQCCTAGCSGNANCS